MNLTPAQRHARLLAAYRAGLVASSTVARAIAAGDVLAGIECDALKDCIDRALAGFEALDELADDLPHVPGADRRRVELLLAAGKA